MLAHTSRDGIMDPGYSEPCCFMGVLTGSGVIAHLLRFMNKKNQLGNK